MKNYRVTVNGVAYDVVVEEVEEGSAPVAAPVSAPAASAPKPQPAPAGKEGANAVKAPMPGNILKVLVKPGSAFKKGDVLCILEAMKMENEIMAPHDATVVQVVSEVGTKVDTGTPIIVLG